MCVNGAAAGWPRNGRTPSRATPPELASMEPRPVGRGMCARLCKDDTCGGRRQWSRGRLAAECRRAGLERRAAERRQWSRGRLAAEWTRNRSWRRRARRVNGAAAGWPRNAALRTSSTALPRSRQWSRGRLAAEWTVASILRARCISRQWSRGRLAAEWVHGPPAGRRGGAASMEPRPVGRGMGYVANGTTDAAKASMEPRPVGRGMAEKTCLSSCILQRQWSRGRLAAE